MSILDIFHQRSHIKKNVEIVLTGEVSQRNLVCYRCDRELGPSHDEEKCQRKGTTRRFFFGVVGGIVGAGALGVSSESASAAATSIIDAGLFGKNTKAVVDAVRNLPETPKSSRGGIVVKAGDIIQFEGKEVQLAYEWTNVPEHPIFKNPMTSGYLETFQNGEGKLKFKHDTKVYQAYNKDGYRVPLRIIHGDSTEAKLIDGFERKKVSEDDPASFEKYVIDRYRQRGMRPPEKISRPGVLTTRAKSSIPPRSAARIPESEKNARQELFGFSKVARTEENESHPTFLRMLQGYLIPGPVGKLPA